MTTLVLLDTNTYLRLAKRVRPFVGLKFGQVPYLLAIHKVTEDEVHCSAHLKFKNPWFDGPEFANELAKDFKDIKVWHGYELLAKLKTAKVVDDALVRDIYEALETNGDMTKTWEDAKHKVFKKIFGPVPAA